MWGNPQSCGMGLDIHGLKLLLNARQSGARFDRVLTFGRIEMAVSPEQAASVLRSRGFASQPVEALARSTPPWYAESVFEALGAKEVLQRQAERQAIIEAREARAAERKLTREAEAAEQARLDALKAEEQKRLEAEAAAAKLEEAKLEASKVLAAKAARDAKYAARKARR